MSTASLFVLAAAFTGTPDGVLLDFTAKWCQPCQQMNPVVSRLERAGLPVRKVDVDQERALAQRCGVTSIPCFVLVVRGRIVEKLTGTQSESELRRLVAQIPMKEETLIAATPPAKAPVALATALDAVPPVIRTASAEEPAQEAEKTKSRFQFPFFRRQEPVAQANASSQIAQADEPPVIRAKFDSRDDLQPTSTAFSPLASSVRILVRDDRGINFGSGTIIDSRRGRSVILTCGHIFRDLRKDSSVEVDVYAGERTEKYAGRVLKYDLQADVGLLAIPTESALSVSPVAAPGCVSEPGQAVYSIGCGGGEAPSRLDVQITSINRYRGPDNIECTGVPQQGRSGGGLFNQAGELLGVCFAANPEDQRGLYAGLKPIYQLLDEAELSHVYQRSQPQGVPAEALVDRGAPAPGRALAPTTGSEPAAMNASTASAAKSRPELDARQMEELRGVLDRSGEAEVVCIIRPVNDPQAASRVVIINRASPKFVAYLTGEMERQPQPTTGTILFDTPEENRPAEDFEHRGNAGAVQAYRRHVSAPEPDPIQAYRRSAESR